MVFTAIEDFLEPIFEQCPQILQKKKMIEQEAFKEE